MVQLFSYGFEDDPVKIWDIWGGEKCPDDLERALKNPDIVFVFHNAWFDRLGLRHCLGIDLPLERVQCSMAQAFSHGLPGGLEAAGNILGIREDQKKLRKGKALMQFFYSPKPQRDGTLKWNTPQEFPEQWAEYKQYCINDTEAMRAIIKKMPAWNYPNNPFEVALWRLDQIVNERGLPMDLELAKAAVRAVDNAQFDLAKRTKEITDGAVGAASQRDEMLKYILEAYGIELPNLQKATLNNLLDSSELPEPVMELLRVRLDTCTSSTAKYKKILQCTDEDGNCRGTVQFSGASRTQRDSGRLVQLQNFAKPTISHEDVMLGIEALKLDMAEFLGYPTMKLCSSALRYTVAAPSGYRFVIADLSAIEGRVLPWLAGEEWKLQHFRDFDAGKVPYDFYVLSYAKAVGINPGDVPKDKRTIGKVQELSLGYGGGVGGMLVFTTKYSVNIVAFAASAKSTIPAEILQGAESFYDWLNQKDIAAAKKMAEDVDPLANWEDFYKAKSTHALPKNVFSALDSLKRLWRLAHPAIVDFWKSAETACRNAVYVPKEKFYFQACFAQRLGKWVRIVLPNGHSLCYPGMNVDDSNQLYFYGVDQFSKKWQRINTYGPKIVENLTQAFARDVFKYGELLAEENGYKTVLPLHDELATLVPDTTEYSVEGLEHNMTVVPPWAEGLPLAAKGFEDYRYHKSLD